METLRRKILTNWHFMRWVRLIIGLVIAFQAFQLQNGLIGFLSALFIFQALTDTGCCGPAGCAVAPSKKPIQKFENVEFEEIQTPKDRK